MRRDIATSIYSPFRITNSEHQLFADEFQFFSDCLALICLKSGSFVIYEVENHISLLNHTLFIADCTINSSFSINQTEQTIKQLKYLIETHPLLSEKDTVLTEDTKRKSQIDSWLVNIQNEPINKGNVLQTLINIRDYIDEIRKIMEPDYLDVVVKCIYTKFGCKHTLRYHKKDFENLARIIFSYYYLQGRSREAISKFVGKALSSDVRTSEHYIYADTYLPEELYKRQIEHNRNSTEFNQQLHDDIVNYVSTRGSIGQAKSLGYIIHYIKHEHNLLFRLDGLIINNDSHSELDFLGLKIISITDFKKKFEGYDFESYSSGFFSNEHQSAIVEITVKAFDIQDAVYLAIEELSYKLGKIMRAINCRFAINKKLYSFHEKGVNYFWANTMPEVASLDMHALENLKVSEDRISKSPHSQFYNDLEYILQQGYLEDNITISIHFYRKFMDLLARQIDDCGVNSMSGIPKEIIYVAYLLLFLEKKKFQREIRIWAHTRIRNIIFHRTSNDELVNKYNQLIRETEQLPSLKVIRQHLVPEHEHNIYETTRALNYNKRFDKKASFDFYIRQLLFIKQYRDKHEHVNIIDDKIARKLGVNTYNILNQLNRDIFTELNMNLNSGKTHGEILKEMVLSAKESINT